MPWFWPLLLSLWVTLGLLFWVSIFWHGPCHSAADQSAFTLAHRVPDGTALSVSGDQFRAFSFLTNKRAKPHLQTPCGWVLFEGLGSKCLWEKQHSRNSPVLHVEGWCFSVRGGMTLGMGHILLLPGGGGSLCSACVDSKPCPPSITFPWFVTANDTTVVDKQFSHKIAQQRCAVCQNPRTTSRRDRPKVCGTTSLSCWLCLFPNKIQIWPLIRFRPEGYLVLVTAMTLRGWVVDHCSCVVRYPAEEVLWTSPMSKLFFGLCHCYRCHSLVGVNFPFSLK